MSVNKRWHRADLVISPIGCVIAAVAASVLFVLIVVVWSK